MMKDFKNLSGIYIKFSFIKKRIMKMKRNESEKKFRNIPGIISRRLKIIEKETTNQLQTSQRRVSVVITSERVVYE